MVHKGLHNALTTVRDCDREVIQVASASIVATEDCPDNFFLSNGDRAQVWIAPKERGDCVQRVRLVELQTLNRRPQVHGSWVVGQGKRSNFYARGYWHGIRPNVCGHREPPSRVLSGFAETQAGGDAVERVASPTFTLSQFPQSTP